MNPELELEQALLKIKELELEQVRHIEILTEEFSKTIKTLETELSQVNKYTGCKCRYYEDERSIMLETKIKELEAKLQVAVEIIKNCQIHFRQVDMGLLNCELNEADEKIKAK